MATQSIAHDPALEGSGQGQAPFGFPVPLTEKYRPRRIPDFAGLGKQRKILSKFAANPYPSAWLFLGASGTGKTTMALALAAEIGAEVHHIPSQDCNVQNLAEVIRMCWYVPQGGGFHLVLLDEADQMSHAAQLALLSKMDSTAFPPMTIFVFTCNATDRLEARFLSRCRNLEFSTYGLGPEIICLLKQVWNEESPDAEAPNFARIVKDSANNAREALTKLELALMEA